jgi:hypothetical protein
VAEDVKKYLVVPSAMIRGALASLGLFIIFFKKYFFFQVLSGPFGHDPRRAGLPGSVYYLKKKYFVFQVLSGIFGHDPGALASLGLCIIFFM